MKPVSYKDKLRKKIDVGKIPIHRILIHRIHVKTQKFTNNFTWSNKNSKKIELTVGLPLFRSQKTIWLSL